jgi:hypothetical protein
MIRNQRISASSFDALVHAWNHLRPYERQERVAQCKREGHDYRECPFSEPHDRLYVCRRCMNYVRPEKRKIA